MDTDEKEINYPDQYSQSREDDLDLLEQMRMSSEYGGGMGGQGAPIYCGGEVDPKLAHKISMLIKKTKKESWADRLDAFVGI